MRNKKGAVLKIITSVIGSLLVLVSLYFFLVEKLMHAGIIGLIGSIILACSLVGNN